MRGKQKADCRADTRGGPWAGIPRCVIDSAAYRSLSVHARAVMVEIVARMNGYNNGTIGVSQRELVEAVGCSPNRIVTAIADLVDRGLLAVTVEGEWKARLARQYRLTFVTTKNAPATNEYLRWTPTMKKSGATGAIAEGDCSATGAVATTHVAATGAIARLLDHQRKTAVFENEPATGAVSLIGKPYPAAQRSSAQGDGFTPETPSGPRCCEHCGGPFDLVRADRAFIRRFCSETCRKAAERARAYRRSRAAIEAPMAAAR
jgi:hypothetical protein